MQGAWVHGGCDVSLLCRGPAELEAENTALADSLVARMARPQPAAANEPAVNVVERAGRAAAVAMRKPATGSESGTLAELPALTNTGIAAATPSINRQPGSPGQAAAGAGNRKGTCKEQQLPAGPGDAEELPAAAVPAVPAGKAGQSGEGGPDAEQPGHDASSTPCASSAGKRQRPAGPQKTARKAARSGCSSSPGQKRQKLNGAGEAAEEAPAEAGRRREQKHRILDLSHLSSFACTAKGALDRLRGAGPRRRTADVTLKARAVSGLCWPRFARSEPSC